MKVFTIIMEKESDVTDRKLKTKSTQTLSKNEIVSDFAGYTTVHGVHRIVESKFCIQKFLWICLFLGSWSFFVFEVYRLSVYFAS